MLVTTTRSANEQTVTRAALYAGQLQAAVVARNDLPLSKLQQQTEDACLLVVSADGMQLYCGDHAPLHFHPGTSVIRIKRLRSGEPENLIEACGAREGDTVIDCTAGMATDAILLAHAVGPAGRVTALESEPLLALIVREGLRTHVSGIRDVDDAMRRIQLIESEHGEYLRKLPAKSADIVYFDPMFRHPIEASSSISPLRRLANHQPLQRESVLEAVRVARKAVVMKEQRDSGEFARLGFERMLRSRTKIAYGVIDP